MTDINTTLETSGGDPKVTKSPPQSTTRVIVLHLCQCKVSRLRYAVSALRAHVESRCYR